MSSPVVIVTGASRGIGLSIARVLLAKKARVVAIGRTPLSSLPEIQALSSSHGDTFSYLSVDLTDESASSAIVNHVLHSLRFQHIDAVVHNAGVIDPIAKIADADLNAWRKCMEVNLFSGVALAQATLPTLRKTKGRFILVSSGAAVGPKEGWNAYCSAKAAANMFIAGLGQEEKDVVSVALRPGVVDTEMQRVIREQGKAAMGDDSHAFFVQKHMDGQLLHPDVPGHVIAMLALSAPKELTGQFLSWDDSKLSTFRKP
ncbi:hypothetical protein HDU85_004794 [Gaertneriomyces sp. JEL0708]|nr:hypothetical protein HDU85_004794 [Gaertneriomyces sp. JEL0708]